MASLAQINIRLSADLKEFSKQMDNVNRKLSGIGSNLQKVGAGLTASISLPLIGLGGLAVKTFADFEDGMAKVNAISGATSDQFKKLKENALELGASTRFTASEVAELQLNLSKLGFKPEEILEATSATLDLAIATGEDLANSAAVAASTIRAFKLDTSETIRVVDVMAKSFSSSALDLEKFKTSMAILAPVAKTAGVTLEESVGLLSVLVNAGVDASTAGTGLRNVFLDLADSGLSLDQALSQIQNSTNKNKTAMDLFGKRGATVATIIADNITEAREFAKVYEGAAGSATKMAEIMDNTLQGSFARMKSAIEGAAISLGEQLAPYIRKAADYIGTLVTKFTALSPEVKKVIIVISGIAAAIGPLLALAGTILPAIGTGFTLLTGPIGLIVAGLTAVGVIIYKNWAPIKQTLRDIANYFIDLYNQSLPFRAIVENVVLNFKNLFEVGKFVFETLKNIIGSFIDNFVTGFKTVGAIIKAVFTGNLKAIPGIIADSGKEGLKNFSGFTKELAADWKNLTNGLKTNFNTAIDNVKGKQIKLLKDDVDAKGVTEAVSNAASKGLTEGVTGATGTGKGKPVVEEGPKAFDLKKLEELITSTGGKIDAAKLDAAGESFLGIMADAMDRDLEEKVEPTLSAFQTKLEEFKESSKNIMQNISESFVEGFANVVAGVLQGTNGFGAVGGLLLSTLGELATQIGKAAVKIGLTMKAVKLSFSNPFTAIAAGAGLLVVGALLKSLANNFGGGSLPKFESGGVVGGTSYYGDKILARVNSGELILNQKQQKILYGLMNNNNSEPQVIIPNVVLKGEDMLIQFERATTRKNRRG